MRPSDLPIGTTFGSYTVCGPAVSTGSDRYWPCRCVCSVERLVKGGNLKSGRSNSCGCQAGKRISQRAAARSGRPRKSAVRPETSGSVLLGVVAPVSAPEPPPVLSPSLRLAQSMRKAGARWSEILDVTGLTREEVEG